MFLMPRTHGIARSIGALGQSEVINLECGYFSDQKRAEEILERMWITPQERVGCFPHEGLRADSSPRFPNLPRQNDRGDRGTDKPDARHNGR